MSENEDAKLELRLGLPGDHHHHHHQVWCSQKNNNICRERKNESLLSLNYNSTYLQNYQTDPKERVAEKKGSVNTAGSQKRAAPGPVVGWPPVRSCRKNLASTSSAKAITEPQNTNPTKPSLNEKPGVENTHKGLFVKINMDGVPIGRKVDLKAYDSYVKLSFAVDELFRGLLAAQRDSSCDGMMNEKAQEQKPITGLLDGSGEYTLVYEDNEGDRMLVGDVPWPMFVSTVKRLRVLKSCDLPKLSRGGSKESSMRVDSASK